MVNVFPAFLSSFPSAGDRNVDIGTERSVGNLQIDDVPCLLGTSGSVQQAGFSETVSSVGASPGGDRSTLGTVIKRWHDEQHATFNKAIALQTLCRLQRLRPKSSNNNRDEIEKLLQRWQEIPPALPETAGGNVDLWPGRDELRQSMPGILMSQFLPSWLEPATSDVAEAISDITSTLRQTGWMPRLDQRIAQAPWFREIRAEYAHVSETLQRALTEFIDVRAEVLVPVQKGKLEQGTIDLYRASHATLAHYIDTAAAARVAHRQAAGIMRYRLEDNRASTTVKVIRAGAAATAANILSPRFEAAQMTARNSDRARANRVADELNMRFADILHDGCEAKAASQLKETDIDPRKLRKQWRGPIEPRLELLIV